MDLLDKTGVPMKKPGDGLSHKDINNINIAVNNVIDVVNKDIQNYCNINDEVNLPNQKFTFLEAVTRVPISRRKNGTVIKYLDINNRHQELVFNSVNKSITEEDWINIDNWFYPFSEIDGGTWSISDDF
jgi:hypothetical protein